VYDIVAVGHFSIDSIILPTRTGPFTVLGGSVAYTSLAANRLDSRVAVISKVGADFPEAYKWWLGEENIHLSHVVKREDASTTSYELKYNTDLSDRVLKLRSKAPSITVEDLPESLKAEAIHLAPIAGEITYETAEKLRNHANLISLDPQGLLRRFDSEGNVTIAPPEDKRLLGLVDIYKSSLKEILTLTEMSDIESAIKGVHDCGVSIVIVTQGSGGAAVSIEDKIHDVPAYTPTAFVDPTGAGDVFIGSFLAEYTRGEDCSWCAHVGSAAASCVIEGIGPTSLGSRDEVYRRARVLYQKEIKH
jgi:sugar/nucleoside kinase (ribokinase family)